VNHQQLLVLIVADGLQDDIVDTLILLEEISGFSLSTIEGYSREHSQFNLRELVEGHRKMSRFEILHDAAQENEILAVLGAACGDRQARYWIIPTRSGHLGN
jgi:Protein of unknown function (DUF3240)